MKWIVKLFGIVLFVSIVFTVLDIISLFILPIPVVIGKWVIIADYIDLLTTSILVGCVKPKHLLWKIGIVTAAFIPLGDFLYESSGIPFEWLTSVPFNDMIFGNFGWIKYSILIFILPLTAWIFTVTIGPWCVEVIHKKLLKLKSKKPQV